MKISMHQEIRALEKTYQIESENHHFKAVANRQAFFYKRKISLYDRNQKVIVNINENSPFTPILEKIPIVNSLLTVPYEIHGQVSGKIIVKHSFIQSHFFIYIDGIQYCCYQHTGGLIGEMYSIFRQNHQIGMIKKNKKLQWNTRSYEAEFDDDTEVLMNSHFLVLVEVFWGLTDSNINGTVYQTSTEFSWGLDMKFGKQPDLKWKPKKLEPFDGVRQV